MDANDRLRVEQLCPELRAIVDAELAAGNWVAETWTDWGFVVLLGAPFLCDHAANGQMIVHRDVNDPHYWSREFRCIDHHQVVACRFMGARHGRES